MRALLGGEPVTGLPELRACRAGQGWQWDGVRFRVLHPLRLGTSDNDSSCVLLVDNGRRSALLPGDITRSGEASLTPMLPRKPLDFLVAAHHGSRSSSTADFVAAARPRIVALSAGFLNRFGHPHHEVLQRFENAGARLISTGAVRGGVVALTQPDQVQEWRRRSPRTGALGRRLQPKRLIIIRSCATSRVFSSAVRKRPISRFFAARTDRDSIAVPGVACRLDQEPRKKTREAIGALGALMAFFDDQFVSREG